MGFWSTIPKIIWIINIEKRKTEVSFLLVYKWDMETERFTLEMMIVVLAFGSASENLLESVLQKVACTTVELPWKGFPVFQVKKPLFLVGTNKKQTFSILISVTSQNFRSWKRPQKIKSNTPLKQVLYSRSCRWASRMNISIKGASASTLDNVFQCSIIQVLLHFCVELSVFKF